MYALVWLYVCCTAALSAAVAVQQFWNEDEFCQKLNNINFEKSLVGDFTDVTDKNITCIQFNNSVSNRDDTNFLNNVHLLCREIDSLTYIWDSNNTNNDIIIIVEFMSYKKPDLHFINKTSLSYITFNNLEPSTEYVARFWTLINGTSYYTTDTPIYTTIQETRIPDPVEEVRISHFDTTENSNITALFTWKPSIDMNCHYKIFYQFNNMILNKQWLKVTRSFETVLTGLQSDTEYFLSIMSFYELKNLTTLSSDKTKLKFDTPTCLEINNNNVELCPPGKPYNVTVTENRVTAAKADDRLDVMVNWTCPNGGRGVEYFTVKLNQQEANASGASTHVQFVDVSLQEKDFYYVSVQAFSRVGRSAETSVLLHKRPRLVEYQPAVTGDDGARPHSYGYAWAVVAVPLASVVFAACAAAAVVQVCRRRRSAAGSDASTNRGGDYYHGLAAALKRLDDVYVLLNRDDVVVSKELLGRGNFGVVRKAVLRTDRGEFPVAVKTLHEHASGREMEQFVGEILLMQKVGKHPNVVAMIGCCRDPSTRCMLVSEFCPLGDLHTYLRRVNLKSWYANDFYVDRTESAGVTAPNSKEVKLLNTEDSIQTTTTMMTPPMVFNNCYLYHSEENVFLTIDDLMLFASQAANGMAFLEKNRIVHRDLAARNLLLSDHHTVKICDFGLSRDVYEQNLYQKSNRGDLLPIKWMALESLKYRVYTTQSDVWSFGVLLWEIMMLGGTPYPTIHPSSIYELLSRGYRMPRPTLCCYSLYEVMLACWHSNPANRPKFDSIKETIDSIIENQYS